jgi:hypothetical protein
MADTTATADTKTAADPWRDWATAQAEKLATAGVSPPAGETWEEVLSRIAGGATLDAAQWRELALRLADRAENIVALSAARLVDPDYVERSTLIKAGRDVMDVVHEIRRVGA